MSGFFNLLDSQLKSSLPTASKSLARQRLKEANDCTVLAVASAFDVDYEIAHRVLQRLGRKSRKGFDVVTHGPAIARLLAEETGQRYTGAAILLCSPITVLQALEYLKKGNHKNAILVFKSSNYSTTNIHHAVAVVDGILCNELEGQEFFLVYQIFTIHKV